MKHVNKERIKSIVLIALFVISLIQVGILWSEQSHRLPISFLTGIFSKPRIPVTDEITRDELFVPYRLVLSNGDSTHWILDRKNSLYKPLWEETKGYLNEIVSGNISPMAGGQENWGDITSKKGFVFEFKTAISPELLKWFVGNPNSTVEIPAVYKIMVVPDNSNKSLNAIYIYNMDNKTGGKVYRYQSWKFTRDKSFTEIVTAFKEDNEDAYRSYYTMHDSKLDEGWNGVEPDILYVSASPAVWPYSAVSCIVPDSISNEDSLADALLGSQQKERYEKKKYSNGVIQFSSSDILYKILPEGIIQYDNFSEADSGIREDVGGALRNAYDFIKKAVSLTDSKADIYLSGLDPLQNGTYRFSFDYMINGYPVYIDLLPPGSEEKASNAITIVANSKKVLNCRYIIREFAAADKSNYKDRFFDVMNDSNIDRNEMKPRDMGVGYVMDSFEDKQLAPYMVMENKDTGLITKKLPNTTAKTTELSLQK